MADPYLGEIRMFGGTFAPRGWALCDGQLLVPGKNEALFSLLGTTYGGDGRTTFGLPDLRGRVAIHQGHGTGLSSRNLGSKGGGETERLTTSEIPRHSHHLTGQTAPATSSAPGGLVLADATFTAYRTTSGTTPTSPLSSQAITDAGNGEAHANMMPFLVIHFIIALTGEFPPRN